MLQQEGGKGGQKGIGHGLVVYFVQDLPSVQVIGAVEVLLNGLIDFFLKDQSDQILAQHGAAAPVGKDITQGRYIVDDISPFIDAGIGTGAQDAGDAG